MKTRTVYKVILANISDGRSWDYYEQPRVRYLSGQKSLVELYATEYLPIVMPYEAKAYMYKLSKKQTEKLEGIITFVARDFLSRQIGKKLIERKEDCEKRQLKLQEDIAKTDRAIRLIERESERRK
jgi:hypothetical protein